MIGLACCRQQGSRFDRSPWLRSAAKACMQPEGCNSIPATSPRCRPKQLSGDRSPIQVPDLAVRVPAPPPSANPAATRPAYCVMLTSAPAASPFAFASSFSALDGITPSPASAPGAPTARIA